MTIRSGTILAATMGTISPAAIAGRKSHLISAAPSSMSRPPGLVEPTWHRSQIAAERSGHHMEVWHGTTIIGVRKNGKVVVAGDGQVSLQSTVIKPNAKKVRRLGP